MNVYIYIHRYTIHLYIYIYIGIVSSDVFSTVIATRDSQWQIWIRADLQGEC